MINKQKQIFKIISRLAAIYLAGLAMLAAALLFLAANLLALSGIARASSWHNKYPER